MLQKRPASVVPAGIKFEGVNNHLFKIDNDDEAFSGITCREAFDGSR